MPKCDVEGCPAAEKEFKSPAALGSHKFRAHNILGTEREKRKRTKASKVKAAVRRPVKRPVRRPARRPVVVNLAHDSVNGSSAIQAIRAQAEGYRAKARELDEVAERLQALF